MSKSLSLTKRLDGREQVQACELDLALETRARMHRSSAPYSPLYPTVGRLFPGTFYLNGIDSKWRRTYSRVPLDAKMDAHGSSLAPPLVLRVAEEEKLSTPVTGKLSLLTAAVEGNEKKISEAKKRITCVITGVSAGLPNGNGPVFHPDNLNRLVEGHQCIKPISGRYVIFATDFLTMKTKTLWDVTKSKIAQKQH